MIATVIPSPFLLPLSSVKLGRFVTSIDHPHEAYHESPGADVPEPIVHPFSFTSLQERHGSSRFESGLTSLLSAGVSRRLKSEVRLAPSGGSSYSLDNSDEWFDRAVADPETRKWIEKAAIRGRRVYLIVGIQTITDTSIVQKSDKGRQASARVSTPVGLSVAALTAIMPLVKLAEPAAEGEYRNGDKDELRFKATGEQVCSLQYREVRTKWLSRQLVDPPQLSRTRWWTCAEGSKRNAHQEDSEEDEDISVGLVDVEKLGGEWDEQDFGEGTLYIDSGPGEGWLQFQDALVVSQ